MSTQRSTNMFRILLQWAVCFGMVAVFVVAQSQPSALSASANKNALKPSNSNTNAVTSTPSATPRPMQMVAPQDIGTPVPAGSVPSRAEQAPVVIGRSPRAFTVDANTVALYHFDTQVGNTVLDETGNYTGTLYGNATTTSAGLFNGALWMDGIGDPGSYVRLGPMGNLVSGTIEAYVDFSKACPATNVNSYFTILSAGSEFGGGQTQLALVTWIGLGFAVYANGQWQFANSGINPCRYLGGGNTQPYFPYPVRWPYEAWRFHHVAGTWGPRGVEIWVDGVLHGVNFPRQFDPTNDPYSSSYMCNPQAQINPNNSAYPYCRYPQMGLVPGAYAGGLPPYTTFLIGAGYDYYSRSAPFRGRIDEVRISNIQRTYTVDVVPPSSPTPTQTPDKTNGEYSVDGYTYGLYHLNAVGAWNSVKNEVTQLWNAGLKGSAAIVPAGHFNAGLSLDGNLSYVKADPLNIPYSGAVEAWINPAQTNSPYMIISNSNEPGGHYAASIFLGMESLGTIRLGIQNNDNWYWADSGVNYNNLTGCWHHVAGTWGARGMEIWIDGVLMGTDSFTGYPAPSNTYIFGCDAWSRCFKGRMDEVRISNVQRSFAPPNAPVRLRAPAASGTLTFLPMIQVVPTPACPYG